VDGISAYVTTILKLFRDPLRSPKPGRPRLLVWDDLHMVQVVKHRVRRRLCSITRRLAYGSLSRAEAIKQATQVDLGRINTACIERLHATLRSWMPGLVRRTRTRSGRRERLEAAMYWTGCVYNFWQVHATLAGVPAMAADLTDHVWSIDELIRYRCRRV
jgi:hypothetical protein